MSGAGKDISWIACFALALGACGPSTNGPFDSESVISATCPVNYDQRGSFMAKVGSFPLHVQVDSQFTQNERMSIDAAASRWNQYGQELGVGPLYDIRFTQLSPALMAADPRDCSDTNFGAPDTFSIVRETSEDRWVNQLKFTDSIPGVTLRCFSGGLVDHQVILIYGAVIDQDQFTSVALHEFGHAIGLDHSCASTTGTPGPKFISCDGIPDSHPYHQAVMFPSLRSRSSVSDLPEMKESLGDNDKMRAGCLYGAGH